jgi:hypothetical protein
MGARSQRMMSRTFSSVSVAMADLAQAVGVSQRQRLSKCIWFSPLLNHQNGPLMGRSNYSTNHLCRSLAVWPAKRRARSDSVFADTQLSKCISGAPRLVGKSEPPAFLGLRSADCRHQWCAPIWEPSARRNETLSAGRASLYVISAERWRRCRCQGGGASGRAVPSDTTRYKGSVSTYQPPNHSLQLFPSGDRSAQ